MSRLKWTLLYVEWLVVQIWLTLVAFEVCTAPTWLFLLIRSVISPEGFWENLVLMVLGIVLLGLPQIILLIALIVVFVMLWII